MRPPNFADSKLARRRNPYDTGPIDPVATTVAGEVPEPITEPTPAASTFESDVLTVDQAAALLRVGRNAVYDAVNRGELPHRRIGKTIRLSRTALIRWLG